MVAFPTPTLFPAAIRYSLFDASVLQQGSSAVAVVVAEHVVDPNLPVEWT